MLFYTVLCNVISDIKFDFTNIARQRGDEIDRGP